MEQAEKTRKRRLTALLLGLILVLALALGSAFEFWQLGRSAYRVQLYQAGQLADSLGQNLETTLRDRQALTKYLAQEFSELETCPDLRTAKSALFALEKRLTNADHQLLLLDENGRFYAADGETFQWKDLSPRTGSAKDFCVAELPLMDRSGMQMLISAPLEPAVSAGGLVDLTRLCLVCDMRELDALLLDDVEQASVLLRPDATLIYRHEGASKLLETDDLPGLLESAEFRSGGSLKQLLLDVAGGVRSDRRFRYGDSAYTVSCRSVAPCGWTLVVLAEEPGAAVLRTAIMALAGAALAGLLILVLAALYSAGYLRRQRVALRRRQQQVAKAEQEAYESKTTFLSNMSHDIRTPMNAIIGMTTIAQRHLDDPEHIKDCLEKVALASDHLLALVNDILDLSKAEAGKMLLNPSLFSLADLITDLAGTVRPQVALKHQNFDMRIHKITHEYLYADELRIRQVFLNLLTNAVEYTPAGGSITLDLTESRGSQPDTVRLTYVVSDTGIGMSQEFQTTMYESFARAEETRGEETQGTGLGLAICKRMTELMGGSIDCVSAENQGTTFTVVLEVPISDQSPAPQKLPPLNILLVDDDGSFLESAAETLEDMGARASCVGNGLDALDRLHRFGCDHDVIIVDREMPLLDGVETIRQMKSMLKERAPLLLLCTCGGSEIEDAARAAGAAGLIHKPFFPTTIYHSLNSQLHFDEHEMRRGEDDGSDLAGMRLLIAEDNDLNWEIIREMMELYDITAHRAENGRECVERIEAAADGAYDLILMDVQMPVMNGRDATRAIRQSQREWVRSLPVIAMTADAFAEDVQACLDAGMNGHVAKPVELKRLFRELRRARRGEFS